MQLLSCRSTCRNVWLTAGRSALHAGVRSVLADITLVAFSFARTGQCNCQPQLAGAAFAFSSRATPMSQDPWMEDGNSLNLTDSAEDEPMYPLHSHVIMRSGPQQMTRPTLPGARELV